MLVKLAAECGVSVFFCLFFVYFFFPAWVYGLFLLRKGCVGRGRGGNGREAGIIEHCGSPKDCFYRDELVRTDEIRVVSEHTQ